MATSHALVAALLLVVTCTGGCCDSADAFGSGASRPDMQTMVEVVAVADVQWEQLNPARGDRSPKAGTVWGDRKAEVATGFLVEFVDGFSSPPHTHNVTYRGVVISGLVHNDDPDAESMWMPSGSFWTQPKGEVHVTASQGMSRAYIEIEAGPYLVLPVDEAFDPGERPVNVDASNIVWLDASSTTRIDGDAEIAFLWGQPANGLHGSMVKLPPGFEGTIRSHGADLRAIVIRGQLEHGSAVTVGRQTLEPGSLFCSTGDVTHGVQCHADEGCVIYVRAEGPYAVVGTQR